MLASNSEVDWRVLELLLTNLSLQLFSDEDYVRKSTVGVLDDIYVIINDYGKKKRSMKKLDSPHWLEVRVLGYIVAHFKSDTGMLPQKLFRRVCCICQYI